ncbi:hypothetical protein AVEN_250505-1 [Araneus ventricosus]|uniref:Uncharacterized protein n=1 Tax=Araneus ventricosus TaxID=182803 RepID=A0A4Y2FKA6_ARAVE|nr:hypothetical protein AVEN_250505-1 [Araneus ventricosus]
MEKLQFQRTQNPSLHAPIPIRGLDARVAAHQRICLDWDLAGRLAAVWGRRNRENRRATLDSEKEAGYLGVQPGRGRKSTRSDVVEDVATAIVEQSMDNVVGCSSARAVSRHLGVPCSTVRNVLSKMVHFFPYKISHNQQLLAIDREKRLTFSLTFLARVEVDAS